jgi:hypothetical protein
MREDQRPDAAAAHDERAALAPAELERQTAELLPERNVMSLIAPGSTSGTSAAALLPVDGMPDDPMPADEPTPADEPMPWEGPPDSMHIM